MAVNININFNGVGSPTVSGLGDRSLAWEEPEEDFDLGYSREYPLLSGFSPTETLLSRAKGKTKAKKKKCEKGQVCGLSCIAKTKTCIANMTTAQLMEHNKSKRAEKKAKAQAKKAAAAGGGGTETPPPNTTEQSPTLSEKLIKRINDDEVNFYDTKVKKDFNLFNKFDLDSLEESVQDFFYVYQDSIGTPEEAKREKQIRALTARYKELEQANIDVKAFIDQGGSDGDREGYKEFLKAKYAEGFEQGRQMARGNPPVPRQAETKGLNDKEKDQLNRFTKTADAILAEKDTAIFIAIDAQHIESALSDRFINSSENRVKDLGYESYRHAAEASFGIRKGNPPPPYTRPIYGYIESSKNISKPQSAHKTTDGYGTVKVELKREVFENNATIYYGDSFGGRSTPRKYGEDMSDVWVNANTSKLPQNAGDLRGGRDYVEAQIYGGVDASKIAALHYPNNSSVPDSVKRLAESNNIQIIIGE